MNKVLILFTIMLSFFSNVCKAQPDEKKIKEYLQTSKFPIDTEASAVVLYESFHYSIHSGLVSHNVRRIIKIIKNDARSVADFKVYIPESDTRNYDYTFKGTTYNLDGNTVKETPLPVKDFYKRKFIKGLSEVSFTMPEVTEGAIIDYSYIIDYPYNPFIPTWVVQGEYPKLYSEYSIFYSAGYTFSSLVHIQHVQKTFKTKEEAINSPDSLSYFVNNAAHVDGVNYSFWVAKNVPAFKNEPYVLNRNNNLERMDLVLIPLDNNYKPINRYSWQLFNNAMWDDAMAKALRKPNDFLAAKVNALIKDDTSKLGKAKAIFNYVRTNIKKNNELKLERSDIESVFNKKEGSSIMINNLLIAMLNKAGLEAYLLGTSTTADVSPDPSSPFAERLTYWACAWAIDSSYVFLDATDKNNVFGLLPLSCYNGYSRVISQNGEGVDLTPDLLEDRSMVSVKITMPNDTVERVELISKPGIITSSEIRKEIAMDSIELNKFFEQYILKISEDAVITDKKIDYLDKPDTNLVIKAVFELRNDARVESYLFNTSFVKAEKRNPFVATTRTFPIEFTCKFNNAFYLTVVFPPGFEPDTIPKPTLISVGDNSLEYRKSLSYYPEMHTFTSNVTYKNNQVVYDSENYNTIREFFEEVIKEENKVLEFKKKKK